jgi:hypothetical protein
MYSRRNAAMLAGTASEVRMLSWGDGDGQFKDYDPGLPTGYDVRDRLKLQGSLLERSESVRDLTVKLVTVVSGDVAKTAAKSARPSATLKSLPCKDYKTLLNAWKKALKWRQALDDALSTLLSVCLSTEQIGDQLFLMLIASAGSAKTRFCDALLVSDGCYALEHLTGFHSGWKGDGEGGYSLLDRIDRKTLVTPEGDVLMSNPAFAQIMSQQRRIFDGKSTASYKNMKEDQSFHGLRTPWIIAGTPALLDSDQAKLGDRFLKVFIDDPDDDEKTHILRRVAHAAMNAVKQRSDKSAEGQLDDRMREAYQLTGGYVDYLRSHTQLLQNVDCSDENLDRCSELGEFTACLRARPAKGKDEVHDAKEMPTRLTHQNVRLAMCQAVVLNKPVVDDEVMRRVRKVAVDTAAGQTLQISRWLAVHQEDGMVPEAVAQVLNKTQDKTKDLLKFMRAISVTEAFEPIDGVTGRKGRQRWRLTEKMHRLYQNVVVDW